LKWKRQKAGACCDRLLLPDPTVFGHPGRDCPHATDPGTVGDFDAEYWEWFMRPLGSDPGPPPGEPMPRWYHRTTMTTPGGTT